MQREWSYQLNNKLQGIKPHISIWPSVTPRNIHVILSRLRIGHSKITHRHLLLGEGENTCPHCHFSALTVQHLLTVTVLDCDRFTSIILILLHQIWDGSPGQKPSSQSYELLKGFKFLLWHLIFFLLFFAFSLLLFNLLFCCFYIVLNGKPHSRLLFLNFSFSAFSSTSLFFVWRSMSFVDLVP